jgi:hypothetical protein
MKRYDFVTTFGQKEKDDGKWVKFEDVEPYIKYQNELIKNLQLSLRLEENANEKRNPVA